MSPRGPLAVAAGVALVAAWLWLFKAVMGPWASKRWRD